MEENVQFCFAPLIMVQQLHVSLLNLKYVSYTKNLSSKPAKNTRTAVLQNYTSKAKRLKFGASMIFFKYLKKGSYAHLVYFFQYFF